MQFIRNKIHRHLVSFYKNVLKIPWLPKCTIESKHCKYFLEGLTVQNAWLNIAGDFLAIIKISF